MKPWIRVPIVVCSGAWFVPKSGIYRRMLPPPNPWKNDLGTYVTYMPRIRVTKDWYHEHAQVMSSIEYFLFRKKVKWLFFFLQRFLQSARYSMMSSILRGFDNNNADRVAFHEFGIVPAAIVAACCGGDIDAHERHFQWDCCACP